MGSLYLLAPRFIANAIMAFLVLGSLMVAPLVLLVPLDPTLLPAAGAAPTGQALRTEVRIVTPVFNVFGAGALFVGAAWGALTFWQRGRAARALANVLIALGALLPSFASGLTRFGISSTLALGQLLGVLCILAGFLVALRADGMGRPGHGATRRAGASGVTAPEADRFVKGL